jgi:myo-inositol-1(or 4)-monophosphatase
MIESIWIETGLQAAHQAGRILAEATQLLRETSRIEEQGRETKIVADARLHNEICATLAGTGLPVHSEEGNTRAPQGDAWCWVIDPLDGSANFQRGFSLCAVSIALCQGSRPRAGFIYDHHTGAIIYGGKDMPGSSQLHCARTASLDRAIICTGIPARLQWSATSVDTFSSIFRSFYKIRMLGSAVQALLHVATGKADVYFENNIMFWDVAAGWALAEAAGAAIHTQPGSRAGSMRMLVSTPALLDPCRNLLMA